MPETRHPRSWVELSLAPGQPGMDALAAGLAAALAGGPAVALVPAAGPQAVLDAIRAAHARLDAAPSTGLDARLDAAPRVGLDAAPSTGLDARHPHQPADLAVICPTSGSTGAPRGVLMTAPALLAAAAARDEAQGGPAAWLAGMPAATSPAVMVALRSARAGMAPLAWTPPPDGSGFTAASFVPLARELQARAAAAGLPARASVVARQFGRLVADPAGLDCLAGFESVLVGGGPVSGQLVAAAARAGVRVVRTYGMTETLGGCVYEGVPVPGVQLAIAAPPAAGGQEPTGTSGGSPHSAPDGGEVLVGGATLAAGYTHGPLPTIGGMLRTGDRGRLREGRLELLGRFDEIVTVGGANVDVARVAAVVAGTEGVVESAVVAVPDPYGGSRLVAHVVGSAEPASIRARVAAELGRAAIPEVRGATALPVLPGGKVDLDSLKEGSL